MKKTALTIASTIALLASTSAAASEQDFANCVDPGMLDVTEPVQLEANGHYYQAIPASGISWNTAKANAAAMPFVDPESGLTFYGHLAIITTFGEDCFIESLRKQTKTHFGGSPEYWVGAEQNPPAPGDKFANWTWINPEAPFTNYTNWQDGEPNDAGGDEMFLGVGHTNTFGWNDEKRLGNIGGYIVEWDVDVVVLTGADLDTCRASEGGGCSTTVEDAQQLTIPDDAFGNNPSLQSTTYRLTDNPARCGEAPLVLFGGDLIISPNHCATAEAGYEFLVVFTEATGIELQQGTIRVVQDAQAALPGFPYTCDQPIATTTSPNDQEVVIYQRTDINDQREFMETWGPFTDPGDELGATADITDSCGSSRARRAENSYSVIGMVQNFGPGSDFDTNRATNFQRWNELVLFKFDLLIEAIDESVGALPEGQRRQIRKQAVQAREKFGEADYSRASSQLRNMLRKVDTANFFPNPLKNFQGEFIERGASTKFIIDEKVIPFE